MYLIMKILSVVSLTAMGRSLRRLKNKAPALLSKNLHPIFSFTSIFISHTFDDKTQFCHQKWTFAFIFDVTRYYAEPKPFVFNTLR